MSARRSTTSRLTLVALVGGHVLVALIVLAAAVVVRAVLHGTDVGPDADEIAKDPILRIELDGAEAADVHTHQGNEGGPMPAMANPDSSASRRWQLPSGDRDELAAIVVDLAVDHDVALWEISCTQNTVSYDGAKAVRLGDDEAFLHVDIRIDQESPQGALEVWVNLESRETKIDPASPPGSRSPIDEKCPAPLLDQFDRVRIR